MSEVSLWAVAIMASRNIPGGTDVRDVPAVVRASSKEEAIGIALTEARLNTFPEKEGWYNHKVSAMRVFDGNP
jgi:hypothetical protein